MAINFLSQINALASVNLNQTQLFKAQIENQANNTGAGTGVEGQIYFDTTLDVLKVWAGGAWTEVGGGVIALASGNTNTITIGGPASNPTIAANTAPVTSGSLNLATGDGIYNFVVGQGYVTSFSVAGNLGTPQTISDGNNLSIVGLGVISTTASATDTLTITHSNVTRADTSNAASPAFGTAFTAVDSVTSNAQGHVTAVNLKTVTLPTPAANTNTTYTLPVAAGAANTAIINLTAGGSGSGVASSVTFSGTTNEIEVTETAGNNGTIVIGLPSNVTVAGALTVSGAGQSSFSGQVTIPTAPVAATDAASKAYVDASVSGALVYQGGYNAATNVPNLDSPPTGTIKKGFMWTVTADGLFFSEQVRVGDSLIAEVDSPTTLADWTTVQSNIDLATLLTVGIGNVNASTGIGVSYANGTATVTNTDLGSSQNIFKNIAVAGQSTVVADTNNDTLTLVAGSNIGITTNTASDTVTIANTYVAPTTSYTATISASATVTHNLGTKDVIIQLYDTVTNETIYADIARPTVNTSTVSFAVVPANPIRVLIQK